MNRRKFINKLAVAIASIPLVGMVFKKKEPLKVVPHSPRSWVDEYGKKHKLYFTIMPTGEGYVSDEHGNRLPGDTKIVLA